VQLEKEKRLQTSGKRHQMRHLEFCLRFLLTEGLRTVHRVAIGGHHRYAIETRHQFVTKTSQFQALLGPVRHGKARQAKGFSYLTSLLTRWRSAVQARTGEQRVVTSNRVCIPGQAIEVEESSGEDGGSSGGTWLVDWWRLERD
jgi:hypothetical protein